MKKIIIFTLFNLLIFSNLYAQNLVVKYNSDQHTLTLKASNVNITQIVKKLASQNVQLYLLDDSTFKVNGNFSNLTLDKALAKIIPFSKKYFYKIDTKNNEEVMLGSIAKNASRRMTLPPILLTVKQVGNKMKSGRKKMPKLKDLNRLKITKQPILTHGVVNKDPFKPKNIVFKNSNAMAIASKIKPTVGAKIRKSDVISTNLALKGLSQKQKKHLVVTYKVTKKGMVPISTSEEDGEYIISTDISGDRAIIGIDKNNIVLANTLENPLEYRSVYKPGVSDHKTFTAKEAYVTIQMPIKYKAAIASKSLNLKLVKFKNTKNTKAILQQIKAKQLFKKDVNTLFKVIRNAPKYDFLKLKSNKQN